MAGPWEDYGPAKPAADDGPWSDYAPDPAAAEAKPATPGFIPTVKRTGGQMLTTLATSVEDITGPNAATKAVKDTGQGIIDRNPAGIGGIGDIVESPWLAVKEATGQFVPQIAAAAGGAAAGGAAGRRIAGAPGAAIGAGIGALTPIFTQEYGGIRQDQQESGQESIPRALGAATAATALERVGLGKALKFIKSPGSVPISSIPAEIGKGVLKEGATEAAQTSIEQVGAFKDPTTKESLQEAGFSGVMGGIGGGVVGGVMGATGKMRPTPAAPSVAAPAAAAPAPAVPTVPAAPTQGDAIRAAAPEVIGPLTGGVAAMAESQAKAVDAAIPTGDAQELTGQAALKARRESDLAQFAADNQGAATLGSGALDSGFDTRELSLEEVAALVAPQDTKAQPIPTGTATELPLETVEPTAAPDPQRTPRTPKPQSTRGMTDADVVKAYVEQRRTEGTLAGRRFAGDFDAGRIKPEDVLAVVRGRKEPTPDERLAAAAAQAPKPRGGIQVPPASKQPRETSRVDQPDASGTARGTSAAGAGRAPVAGGSGVAVGRVAADAGQRQPGSAPATVAGGGEVRPAGDGLPGDAPLTTLQSRREAAKKNVAAPVSTQAPAQARVTEAAAPAPAKSMMKPGFDPDAWQKDRDDRVKASREAGNTHLDTVPAYVETMRGKAIRYVHDHKVKGTIRTVDNNGNVYVNWSDAYSAEKEGASPMQDGKKTVMQTSLGPRDLKDYVLDTPAPKNAETAAAAPDQPKTLKERREAARQPERVKVMTRFGQNVYVDKADLESDKPRMRHFTSTGKSLGLIVRENLDPTGEARAADAKEQAENPLSAVIGTKDGRVFASESAAARERSMRGLGDTHDIVPMGNGFVLKRNASPAAPETSTSAQPAPEDDPIAALFGTPAEQAENQRRYMATLEAERQGQEVERANVERVRSAIAAEKKRATAEHDEWAGKVYKANKTQVELRGDGPSRNPSMSIGAINESRRRNAMEALTQELRALDRLDAALKDDAGKVMSNLRDMLQKAERAVASGNWPGMDTDAMFQSMLLDDLKFRGPSGKGNVTSNGLSRAMLAALKVDAAPKTKAPPAPSPAEGVSAPTKAPDGNQALRTQDPEQAARPQPDDAQDAAPRTLKERAAFEHAGLKVYPGRVRVGDKIEDRWAVQLPENKATGKVLGDTLHATREEAMKAAEREVARFEREQRNRAEQDAAEATRKAEEDARKAANRGKSLVERRAEAILDHETSENGERMTRRQWVDRKVSEGLAPRITQEDRIKPLTRSQFNRATGEEQRAHERKIKAGGKKDVYWIGDYEVTKTEHDYAQKRQTQDAPINPPQTPPREAPTQRAGAAEAAETAAVPGAADAGVEAVGVDPFESEKANLTRIKEIAVRQRMDIETDHMRSDGLAATGWSAEGATNAVAPDEKAPPQGQVPEAAAPAAEPAPTTIRERREKKAAPAPEQAPAPEPERNEKLVALRKQLSVLKSIRKCLG